MQKILVIDDDDALRRAILTALRKHGYETLEATSGKSGLEVARTNVPALVLSDVNMPGMDGFGVLKHLRSEPATSGIPFILMTGVPERADMRSSMELGADDYLAKPFSIEDLLAAVRVRLERQGMIQAQSKANEARLLEILAVTQDLVAIAHTETGHFLYLNAAGRKMLGIEAEEDISLLCLADFHAEEERAESLEKAAQAKTDGVWVGESHLLGRQGQRIPVSKQILAHHPQDGQPPYLSIVARDITERKRMEQALGKINQCFLGFGEDIQANISQLTCLTRDLANADCALYWQKHLAKVIAAAQRGETQCSKGTISIPAGFLHKLAARPKDKLVIWQSAVEDLGGSEPPESTWKEFRTWMVQPVGAGEASVGCLGLLYRQPVEAPAGIERALEIIAAAIRVEEDRWKAQRERDLIEVQLRQAQKLEAIGQLAAGIAHEINTPTQYVGDNTRFLKDSFKSLQTVLEAHQRILEAARANALSQDMIAQVEETERTNDLAYLFEQIPSAIDESLEGIDRITKIVRAMKEFSHPGGKEKVLADLNKAIETTVTVARNEWKYVADLKLELDPNLPPVPCFLGEFNQAVLNLVINAAHAVAEVVKQQPGAKGVITVRTRRERDQVEVRVADSGTGIPETARPHIFEPFFTTKPVGKGTGQGLSIVYSSIVKKHGGTVRFESQVGHGTTFIICLPVTPASSQGPQPDLLGKPPPVP